MTRARLLMFTDLDGTLLDARTYSFEPARDAVALLKARGVPLVICTSKTAAEILYWRERLGNSDPFICENGGGIYAPSGYFKSGVPAAVERDGYLLAGLGTRYGRLREALASLREQGFDVYGFGDMTAAQVARLTGLDAEQARMAMAREYDEPFVYGGDRESLPSMLEAIRRMGLNFTEGRLMHILGDNDKGKAVRMVRGLYEKEYGDVAAAAVGDGYNDAPMLAAVDHPFLVRKPDGSHEARITGPGVTQTDGVGPAGWAEAVTGLLKDMGLA